MKFWRNSAVEFLFVEAGANMLSTQQNSCSKRLFEKLSGFPFGISPVNLTKKLWSHLLKKSLMESFHFCAVSVLKKDSLLSTMDVLGVSQLFSEQVFLSKQWTGASQNSNILFFYNTNGGLWMDK